MMNKCPLTWRGVQRLQGHKQIQSERRTQDHKLFRQCIEIFAISEIQICPSNYKAHLAVGSD